MIFVTVGTQKFNFNRLLKKIDEFVENKTITDSIFVQTGHCTYIPKNCEHAKFLAPQEMTQKFKDCSMVISHGGVGSILDALYLGKTVIACPRLATYKEHVDDHQKEICKKYGELNYIIYCEDVENLAAAIEKAKNFKSLYKVFDGSKQKICDTICEFLDGLNNKEKSRKNKGD